MILATSVSCHTMADCDSRTIGTLVNNIIREIQTEDKGKIVDVKLTSAATHGYINTTALILYKVNDND
jgi:hypothetical protein